jgi:hypothetical protein
VKQNKLYNVAIYCRLSLDDGNEGDSSSIKTQKIMLEEYVKEKGFNIYDYYIDDGFSGLNFNRPAFKRMIKRIKKNYPKYKFIITGDALYSNTPIINLCKTYNWYYIFNLKPERLKEVNETFEDNINYKN